MFSQCGDHPWLTENLILHGLRVLILLFHRDSKIPVPPEGHKWKEVRCDNTVTWLASWTENIQNTLKYIMLNPSSKLKVGMVPLVR